MKALVFERKVPKFAAAMVAGAIRPGSGAKVGPLRLKDVDPPPLPGPDWVYIKPRLAGICGSDLATIDGTSSRYFEPIVSFPFTMGHEVVADLIDPANGITEADGSHRVVVEPVLGCVARGIDPACDACASGRLGNCTNIAFGDLHPGLQSGFCCDTGGGWSTLMVAHRSQLHAVPDTMSDEAAVMIEPTACAIHAALAGPTAGGMKAVVVIGAGTLGLLSIAALRRFIQAEDDTKIIAVAKHPLQRRLARELGADVVVEPDEVRRAVRRVVGTMAIGDGSITRLTGGADRVLDCVGSSASITEALAVVQPRGWVNLVGMPGTVEVDLTPLWHKEIALAGAYAYGSELVFDEAHPDGPLSRRRTFDLAIELVQSADLGRLVTSTYPLARFEDAITHAATAGGRGAVKIAFDLRAEKERARL